MDLVKMMNLNPPKSETKPAIIESYEQLQTIEKNWTENIKKSEILRAQINKAINEKKNDRHILVLALECISAMSDDKHFYTQNIKNLK